jgi:hypothetical protein
MKHNRLPATVCVECGKLVDSATHLSDDVRPSPGDIAICLYCGHAAIYTRAMTLRHPTKKEKREHASNPEVAAAKRAQELSWWTGQEIKQ